MGRNAGSYLLGLDLGTSSLKGVLMAPDGRVLADASESYPTLRPHQGWSEQDPADWLAAVRRVAAALAQRMPAEFSALGGIGLCSAAHLPVLLDARNRVLRPAILWNDMRSVAEVEFLTRHHLDAIRAIAANEPSCTWTLPQLIWVAAHEPAAIRDAACLLSSKDYLGFILTGRKAMDATAAAATLMYDARQGIWSPELTALSGLAPSAFPPILSSEAVLGLTGEGADLLGLPPGIPVITGCLDSAAEMIACGVTGADDGAVVRVGSSGAILAVGTPDHVPGVLNYPLPLGQGHYWQAGTNSAATSVQWIRDLTVSAREGAEFSYASMDRMVASTRPGPDAIIFHPFLQGERAPYWNPALKAGFSGVAISHGWPDFLRAAMEGVAYSLRDCLDLMLERGASVARARLVGGIARSAVWGQIVADVLGFPLEQLEDADSAKGAAMLALAGLHGVDALPKPPVTGMLHPAPDRTDLYSDLFRRYKSLARHMDGVARNGG